MRLNVLENGVALKLGESSQVFSPHGRVRELVRHDCNIDMREEQVDGKWSALKLKTNVIGAATHLHDGPETERSDDKRHLLVDVTGGAGPNFHDLDMQAESRM